MEAKGFRVAFVAMAPDADRTKHRCVIDTPTYQLTAVLVRNEDEAVELCRDLARKSGTHSILLCPGFTNTGVARVAEAAGDDVAVSVSRGDGPSSEIARRRMREAGFGPPGGAHNRGAFRLGSR